MLEAERFVVVAVHVHVNLVLVLLLVLLALGVVLADVLPIDHDLEIARTDIDILPEYDLLTDSSHHVNLTEHCC